MKTTIQPNERHGQDQLIPFLWLRRGIGLLGILFPVILFLGAKIFGNCPNVQPSISDYYHTCMRDVFVGVLWIIGIALFTYRGPKKEDNRATNLACLFAITISLFPTTLKDESSSCHICTNVFTCESIHIVSAVSFFLVLTYIAYSLFPQLEEGAILTQEKLKRNKIYRLCAYIMFGSLIVIGLFMKFCDSLPTNIQKLPILFIFEWIALWAFGMSWIVKGRWFLEDKTPILLQ